LEKLGLPGSEAEGLDYDVVEGTKTAGGNSEQKLDKGDGINFGILVKGWESTR
jgi:hypothetical protein